MKLFMFTIMLAFVSISIASYQQTSEELKLSPELVLRVHVQQLTEQLAEVQTMFAKCRAGAADIQARYDGMLLSAQNTDLKQKHDALEEEIRKSLGAKPTDEVDWTSSPPKLKKPKL